MIRIFSVVIAVLSSSIAWNKYDQLSAFELALPPRHFNSETTYEAFLTGSSQPALTDLRTIAFPYRLPTCTTRTEQHLTSAQRSAASFIVVLSIVVDLQRIMLVIQKGYSC